MNSIRTLGIENPAYGKASMVAADKTQQNVARTASKLEL